MDNKVKNAVLAYRIDNSDGYGSYVELSGLQFSSDEFAFDIWYKSTGLCSSIMSQKNGFSVGIFSDTVIVRLPSGRRLSIQSNITKLPEGVWTNLYLGYDKKEIRIYVNGYLFGSTACTDGIKNSESFEVGAEFTGFVRNIRFYSQTISEENFKNYFMAAGFDSEKMADVAAFMDFTDESIPDLSGKGVQSEIHENCALVDTVEVYCPSKGSFAHFSDSSPFNIGGFESGAFSVYAKIYIRPVEHKRHIIAINGNIGDSQGVAVFADCEDGKTSFTTAIAGEEFTFLSDIKTYSWVDLIVCIKGTQLTVYTNGAMQSAALHQEFKRTDRGDFKLGGCTGSASMTCQHYIHTVAVFDKVLSDKDARDFLENHPFVFEDNLTALVDFSAGSADELVNETEVYVNGSDLLTVSNTVDVLPDEPYQYRINYSATVSEMKSWEAETITEGVISFASGGFALTSTAAAEGIAALKIFLANRAKVLDGAAELYAGKDITSEGYAKAMENMGKGTSKVCFKGLGLSSAGGTGAAVAATAASAVYLKKQEMGISLLVGIGILATVAVTAAKAVEHSRKPKPDKDDEDSNVTLSSLSMQISPDDYTTSAVRCRDYKGVISGAEWTREGKSKKPAVYIADRLKKAKIRVKFKLSGSLDTKTTHTVSLSASVCSGTDKIFDHFSYEKSGLCIGTEYEAELESGITCSEEIDFAYENIELWWNAMVDGKTVVLPNTKLEVFVVPTVPCQPVSLEKEFPDNYISVDYLRILSECTASGSESKVLADRSNAPVRNGNVSELYTLTHNLYYHRKFYYEANQIKYVTWKEHQNPDGTAYTEIHFKEKEFFKDYYDKTSTRIGIQCDIYATILHRFFNFRGVRCRYAYVINPEYDRALGKRATLKVRGAYPAGSQTAKDYDFNYHMILEVAPQPNVTGMDGVRVFDASMGVLDGGLLPDALGNIPFYGTNSMHVDKQAEPSSYRGLAIQDKTAAIINSYAFVLFTE